MRKILLLLLLVVGRYLGLAAQDIVNKDILDRVLLIKYRGNTATCFAANIERNIYLITARHLFSNRLTYGSSVEVELLHNRGWQKATLNLLVHKDSTVDIAVLDGKIRSDSTNTYAIGNRSLSLSQECFFLGYPYGFNIDDDVDKPINQGYPVPFVKKAIISGFVRDRRSTQKRHYVQAILDGINNPGFSGGPVIVFNKEPNSKRRITVIAVISGYYPEQQKVKLPSGESTVLLNSGLVITTPIEYVFEILKDK